MELLSPWECRSRLPRDLALHGEGSATSHGQVIGPHCAAASQAMPGQGPWWSAKRRAQDGRRGQSRSGVFFDALGGLTAGTFDPAQLGFDAAGLAGRSAREIIDRVARFVSPSDGTQDAESSQRAVNAALSDLLDTDPNADIASLHGAADRLGSGAPHRVRNRAAHRTRRGASRSWTTRPVQLLPSPE